jgi:hypothetical protein
MLNSWCLCVVFFFTPGIMYDTHQGVFHFGETTQEVLQVAVRCVCYILGAGSG